MDDTVDTLPDNPIEIAEPVQTPRFVLADAALGDVARARKAVEEAIAHYTERRTALQTDYQTQLREVDRALTSLRGAFPKVERNGHAKPAAVTRPAPSPKATAARGRPAKAIAAAPPVWERVRDLLIQVRHPLTISEVTRRLSLSNSSIVHTEVTRKADVFLRQRTPEGYVVALRAPAPPGA